MSATTIIKSERADTMLIGICFIMAAATSIVGLKLYDPILNSSSYIETAYQYKSQIVFGAINELLLIISAVGTGIFMYPYLNRYHPSMGIAYFSFRMFEAIFISIGMISILTVLSLSIAYHNNSDISLQTANTVGYALKSVHKWCFMLGPNFMLAINTFIYNYVFRKENILPKYLTTWGMIAAALIMCAAIFELFGVFNQLSVWGIILALPIAIFEMTFAVMLIVKGKELFAQGRSG